MSVKELKRQEVMGRVSREEIGLGDAAAMMDVSYRQAKRIWSRYRKQGAQGLVHQSAGRASSRSKPAEFRAQVLAKIEEKYSGEVGQRFGPTLAAEHLDCEDGLQVNAETLRRWMLEAGLWSRARKHKPHRQRRERRGHFGELVQFDGSLHAWFEERGPKCFLMNMVDDATSRTRANFSEQESIWAAVAVLRSWVKQYGIPKALYTDWKKRVRKGANLTAGVAWRSSGDPVWAHVRQAWDPHHCRKLAPGQGLGFTLHLVGVVRYQFFRSQV